LFVLVCNLRVGSAWPYFPEDDRIESVLSMTTTDSELRTSVWPYFPEDDPAESVSSTTGTDSEVTTSLTMSLLSKAASSACFLSDFCNA